MASFPLFTMPCVAPKLVAQSKKHLLKEMCELATQCPAVDAAGLKSRDLLTAVMERERLGTTGTGSGVAIPHARVSGLKSMSAGFARLETPIDYDSVDERPVDLVVLLLAPENAGAEHLRALAQVSRLLRREETRAQLRAAPSLEALYMILAETQASSAA